MVDDFDPNAFLAQSAEPIAPAMAPVGGFATNDFDPDEFIADINEEKYGGLGQQAITAVEGAAQGVLGPIAPAIERGLGVDPEDIRGRQETNPITHGVSEGLALTAGMLTGTGEAALMAKAGIKAAEAVGLGAKAIESGRLIHKVGSAAVREAAEMAIYTSGTEISKLVIEDPEASAETAIANVGLAAALGGAGGALITGAISPLWKATAGPKVEGMLSGLKSHLDGGSSVLPDQVQSAITKLGIEPEAAMRGVLTGEAKAVERFGILKEVQNKEILDGIRKLETDASESVMKSLGIDPTDVEVYSEADAGRQMLSKFTKEYDTKYKPIAEAMERRNKQAAGISVGDDARLDAYAQMLEGGITKVGTDSPYYKLYDEYGQRMLAKDTIGGLDSLKTEINNRIKGLRVGGDFNIINALQDIKQSISAFQEKQIERSFQTAELAKVKDVVAQDAFSARLKKEGAKAAKEEGTEIASPILNDRAETNRKYAEFAQLSEELMSHAGLGKFHGAGSLTGKLEDAISPEDLLKKFSFKGDADFITFLQKNFPETFAEVQKNELKKVLKPAILNAKGEAPLNIKKLNDIVSKGMAGQKEYIESVIPREALERIQAAHTITTAIPNPKSSGTAGWLTKTMNKVPQSAMAMIGMMAGNNPIVGAVLGQTAQWMSRTVPDAVRLGYLKFLGSQNPVKAEGFKAMIDFINIAEKSTRNLKKASAAVFDAGSKVLVSHEMPAKKDLEKLDKAVEELQKNPNGVFANNDSELGYYMPEVQAGVAMASTRALQYLQTLRPSKEQPGPLNTKIPPTPGAQARYERALAIGQNPIVVLNNIKEGTLLETDLKDMGAMYPGLYKHLTTQLTDDMVKAQSEDKLIPYKTRMGLSLFLGQPLDTTMDPLSIQAAQAVFMGKQSESQQSGQTMGSPKRGTATLGKRNTSLQTPLQASENRHATRK